jgi:hypothetical protein
MGTQRSPFFKLISENDFGPEHLEEYPVWSEFYDYDEREEILQWGIDAEWLDNELERVRSGEGHVHGMYPLLETDPFPDRMRIYIKADFETPQGAKLTGYVINEDAYCIGIFLIGEEFKFNEQLASWCRSDLTKLQATLGDPRDPIVPLRYRTDFAGVEGRRIEGVFAFKEDEA